MLPCRVHHRIDINVVYELSTLETHNLYMNNILRSLYWFPFVLATVHFFFFSFSFTLSMHTSTEPSTGCRFFDISVWYRMPYEKRSNRITVICTYLGRNVLYSDFWCVMWLPIKMMVTEKKCLHNTMKYDFRECEKSRKRQFPILFYFQLILSLAGGHLFDPAQWIKKKAKEENGKQKLWNNWNENK